MSLLCITFVNNRVIYNCKHMINVEKFAERLHIIMEYYELTAAFFAEKIDVQRSSISHILSGRNKPSLEFVLKILKEFPEVELYWLLNGVGNFPKSISKNISTPPTLFSDESFKNNKIETTVENKIESLIDGSEDEIDRIVIFFKNGSFKNYKNIP